MLLHCLRLTLTDLFRFSVKVEAYFQRLHFLLPVVDKPSFIIAYSYLMDHRHDVTVVRAQAPFIALVFAVFACASRIVDDPRLNDTDESGLGMVYYERYVVRLLIFYKSLILAAPQSLNPSLYKSSSHTDCSCTMHGSSFIFPLCGKLSTTSMVTGGSGRSYVSGFGSTCTPCAFP